MLRENFKPTCWSLKSVPGSSFLVTSCSQAGAWEQERKEKKKIPACMFMGTGTPALIFLLNKKQ
ncbi:hypothetical protein, partial [Desulfonatronospira sp.]|uniref:hypothetical protein n=1 Tax=Desulfonatronospira sp. TaxID=1962951 RepID=UPI0025C25E19